MVSIIRIRFSHFQSVQYGEFVSMLVVPIISGIPGAGQRLGVMLESLPFMVVCAIITKPRYLPNLPILPKTKGETIR